MRMVIALGLVVGMASVAGAQATDPAREAGRLEGRLEELRRGTQQLEADVGQSHRRLAAIAMSIFENVDGARVTITQANEVGPLYRLVSATYAIDGQTVFHRRDESGALGARDTIEIHDGTLASGDHTLSVVLRYVGDGGVIVRYLEGYRFTVRSSHAFVAEPGRHTRIELRAFARGADVPYERRLDVTYERHTARWR